MTTKYDAKTARRLNALMKAFAVSGKELSGVIYVDESLISKWRNGSRRVKRGSVYLEKIADFFISVDKHNKYGTVRGLLANDYPNVVSCDENNLKLYLKDWLCDESARNDIYAELFEAPNGAGPNDTTIFRHFKGTDGRRQAISLFNDYLIRQSDKLEDITNTTESGQWFYEDESFRKHCNDQLFDAAMSGHVIKVIHPTNRSYDDLALSVVSWLQIHLTGRSVDYYIPDYSESNIQHMYSVIPGRLALMGISSKTYSKSINTWVTNDPDFVRTVVDILQESINKSQPLFKRYYPDSGKAYLNEIWGILRRANTRYFHGSTLQYFPVREELITQICLSNGMTEEEAAKNTELYIRTTASNMGTKSRYIVDVRSLRQNLASASVEFNNMTLIMGKRIEVTQAVYRQIIEEMFADMLYADNIEVGILECDQKDNFERINVMADGNVAVQFIGMVMERPIALVLHELNFVVAIMELMKATWYAIPSIRKDKEYIRRQIMDLIEEVADLPE